MEGSISPENHLRSLGQSGGDRQSQMLNGDATVTLCGASQGKGTQNVRGIKASGFSANGDEQDGDDAIAGPGIDVRGDVVHAGYGSQFIHVCEVSNV
jgi:hypothetical protein